MNGLYSNGYAYKDYGLNSSSLGLQNQDHLSTYMNPEQTFHTPSFGDEEFDIPPLSLHPGMAHDQASVNMAYHHQQQQQQQQQQQHQEQQQHLQQQQQQHQQQQQSMAHAHGMGEMLPPQQSTGNFVSSSNQMMGAPQYQPQAMYMTQMTADNTIRHPNYNNGSGQQTYAVNMNPHQNLMIRGQQPQHNSAGGIAVSSSMPTSSQQAGGLLTTISQSQLTSHLGVHFNMGHPPTGSPRSNQTSPGQETSEDSDDNVHHLGHMLGGLGTKRPSPEPAGGKMGAAVKKPKVPKKKKKRDPNEPQKPVSAYALFFRDTQAAIKGQNPNASFGEVSKIVASMWDSLDEDHKNVYKKRTEAAKKEYLKALAAYRASLVSKSAADHADSMYGTSSLASSSTSPPSHSPPNAVSSSYMVSPQYGSPPTVSSSTRILGASGGSGNSPPQELSPLQKKSPLLTSLMEGGSPQGHSGSLSPQGHPHSVSPPHPNVNQQVMLSNEMQSAQQQMGMMQSLSHQLPSQQQQSQQPPSSSPLQAPSYQTIGMMNNPQASSSPGQGVVGGQNPQMVSYEQQATCLRNGCSNPAMDSPEWDSEYCSNDCVGRFHCMGGLTPNLQLLCFRQVNPMVGTEPLQSYPTSW